MDSQYNFNSLSVIKGQGQAYIFNLLNDINKFKILLVFLNKGFTWHRELETLGLSKNVVAETLIEFNNLGFIQLKQLTELNDVQYETFKIVKNDIQHYFKIYFTTPKIHKLISEYQEDINLILSRNPHLLDFIEIVKKKLLPFKIALDKIIKEETLQFSRKVTIDGIIFEKDTLMSKEVKQILQLTQSKKGSALVLKEIKPLALMTDNERKKHTKKVFHNGKETNHNLFREIEDYEKAAEKDFKTGSVGLSDVEVSIIVENRQIELFKNLGIDEWIDNNRHKLTRGVQR